MNVLQVYLYFACYFAFCIARDFPIFLDESCKKDCTLRNNLPCTVELRTNCPLSVKVPENLWPSGPDGVLNTTSYKYSPKTGQCEVDYNLSWIPPNDASGKTVKGFQLEITSLSGRSVGVQECAIFNLTKASWTNKDIKNQLRFSFNCFKNLNMGTFEINLYSLPHPDTTGLDKGFKQEVHFQPAYYDKDHEKCMIKPPVQPTTERVTTPLPTNPTPHKNQSQPSMNPNPSATPTTSRGRSVTVVDAQQKKTLGPDHEAGLSTLRDPMTVIYILGGITFLSIISILVAVIKNCAKKKGDQLLYSDDRSDVHLLESDTEEPEIYNGDYQPLPTEDPNDTEARHFSNSFMATTTTKPLDSVSRVNVKINNIDRETTVTVEQCVHV